MSMSGFRDLHHAGAPLILPNAWDYASAAALFAAGHPAVGTTSLGVAVAAGKPDAAGATRDETVALTRAIAPLGMVTVDIESGFGGDVAALVRALADAGAVGVNIEDAMGPVAETAERIAAIKAAVPSLFVNARTDTYWLRADDALAESLRRASAYLDAGADGIFVPGATDPDVIEALVAGIDAPLNVLFSPGLDFAALGVARVSTGSLLFRAALGATTAFADAVRDGRPLPELVVPSYEEAATLGELPPAEPRTPL
jgi:2-methylisocitrate lyase-like PEP mutase family enzyme